MRKNIVIGVLIVAVLILSGIIALPFLTNVLNQPTNNVVTPPAVVEVPSAPPAAGQTDKVPTLQASTVVDGLSNPWDIAFISETKFVFTQRANKISVWDNGTITSLNAPADTYVRGEGGMLGMALAADFTTSGHVFLCFNSNLNGVLDVKVARFKLEDNQLIERKDIIVGMPAIESGRHSGCQIEVDKNNIVWVGTGDAATGENPQSPRSLGGKILRVDINGNPVTGNLSAPFDSRIYSYGHRNTQGIAFLNTPNAAGVVGFSMEQGSGVDDEINPLVPGNFGWDPVPGYNESLPMTNSAKYPDAIVSTWSSGNPTEALSGGTIINNSKWGAYNNMIAIAIQKNKKVMVISIDEYGKLKSTQTIISDIGRVRTVQMSPSGDMYALTDNGAGQDAIIMYTVTN